jgi:hypothetical protein
MAREEASRPPLPGVRALAPSFICFAKRPARLCRWKGVGKNLCPTHIRPHPPVTWSSSPEWAAGVPLLLLATAPPRSARAQSLHRHQKIHSVVNARRRRASCFPRRSPQCHPPAPKASPLPSRRAEAPAGRIEHNGGAQAAAPGTEGARA